MTLMFNAVEFIHRLEKAGVGRDAAEAIAQAIEERNAQLTTRADFERLTVEMRTDLARYATKQDLEVAIATALNKQTVQIGALVGGMIALATAIVGVVVSIH